MGFPVRGSGLAAKEIGSQTLVAAHLAALTPYAGCRTPHTAHRTPNNGHLNPNARCHLYVTFNQIIRINYCFN